MNRHTLHAKPPYTEHDCPCPHDTPDKALESLATAQGEQPPEET